MSLVLEIASHSPSRWSFAVLDLLSFLAAAPSLPSTLDILVLGKIEDLELQKTTLEANEKQSQEQEKKIQEQINSLTTALEEAKEQ